MPVLTKSQINRMPISQRRRREADIVYKACYHEAQRQGLWHKHASVQSVNFKAQVLPVLAKPIIEKYKSLGKVSPDFTVEVFSNVINGEASDKPATMPQILTKAVSQPMKFRMPSQAQLAQDGLDRKTLATSKPNTIDGLAEYVESLKAQIAEATSKVAGLQGELDRAETDLSAAIDTLSHKYSRSRHAEIMSEVQTLPGLEMPQDKPAKAKRSNKRSTKRK